MSPEDYMREVVLPTVLEFRDDRRSRRKAYLACIAVFHIKDHLKQVGEKSIEKNLRSASGSAFELVRSVCNGTKHVSTDGSHAIAFTAGDDSDRPPAVAGKMTAGLSRVGDSHGGRSVQTPSGLRDIYVCVRELILEIKHQYPTHFSSIDMVGL